MFNGRNKNSGEEHAFIALVDAKNQKLQQFHSCVLYINGMCDDTHGNMTAFADKRYDKYMARISYNLIKGQNL